MICCSFIFTPGEYDEEFHQLDQEIGDYAFALAGFDRVEKWQSADGKTRNVMYFFEDQESVSKLARFPQHRVAKDRFAQWYLGYRVDIFELKSSYGKQTETLNTGANPAN